MKKGSRRSFQRPYLTSNPPTHWALTRLGETLPEWLKGHKNKQLAQSATIDWVTQRAFWIEKHKPVVFEELSQEELLSTPLKLQPDVAVFSLRHDLLSLRAQLTKHPVEYWEKNPLPEVLEGIFHFAIFRDQNNKVQSKPLLFGEYTMLTYFQKGCTIQEACDKIGKVAPQEAEETLPLWFRSWTYLQWFRSA